MNRDNVLVGLSIALIVLVIVLFSMNISAKNSVARLEVGIDKCDSDVSILAERKVVLLNELIDGVKAGVAAEKDILSSVIALRNSANTINVATSISILAEQYPQLKSIDNYGKVMTEMAITENGLATQKQYCNTIRADYVMIFRVWPSSMFLSSYPQKDYPLYVTKLDVVNWKPNWK